MSFKVLEQNEVRTTIGLPVFRLDSELQHLLKVGQRGEPSAAFPALLYVGKLIDMQKKCR